MNDGQNIFSDAQSADAAATEQDAQDAQAQVEAPAEGAATADAAAADTAAAEAAPAEETAADAEAQAAADADAEYRKRLREFQRELKRRPGDWYIIQCYSGYENKVKTNLEMRAQTMGVDEQIHEVIVPVEEVEERKDDGKKKIVKRKLLPGYVLVRMSLDDPSWSVVRDTPGVTSFVGSEGQPSKVKIREVAKFLMPKETITADAADEAAGGEEGRSHRLRGRRVRHHPVRPVRICGCDHLRDRPGHRPHEGSGFHFRPRDPGRAGHR